jgi:hypothetical protein
MSGREALEMADALMAYYMANTRTTARREGYSRTQIKNMPAAWQEACDLAGSYRLVMHDLLGVSTAAGDVPLPITRAKFDRARAYLATKGDEAKNRPAIWCTAIRAIPPNAAHVVAHPEDFADRRERRIRNGPEEVLETGLAEWRLMACAPLVHSFEAREPISEVSADGIADHMRRAVATLTAKDPNQSGISLLEYVSRKKFDAWVEADGEDSPKSTLATIDAFIRIRKDLVGDDAVVAHMRAQRPGRRNAHALSGNAVLQLTKMLSNPRRFELLPIALMEVARRGDLPAHVRLKLANQAPAMHAAIEYALTPSEICGLAENERGGFTPPSRAREAALGPLDCDIVDRLLWQRREIRKVLDASVSQMVMVSPSGVAMEGKQLCNALTRTQCQFGLVTHPWQRYRDYSATRMLQSDKTSLERVSILLSIRNPDLVNLRYAAMLARETEALPETEIRATSGRAA